MRRSRRVEVMEPPSMDATRMTQLVPTIMKSKLFQAAFSPSQYCRGLVPSATSFSTTFQACSKVAEEGGCGEGRGGEGGGRCESGCHCHRSAQGLVYY